jgi:flagellar biosynthesis regulator FlbT
MQGGSYLALNDVLIRNCAERSCNIEILSEVSMLQDRDIMFIDDTSSPLENLYLNVQRLHLATDGTRAPGKAFTELSDTQLALATTNRDEETCRMITEVQALVAHGSTLLALRRIQERIGKPSAQRRNILSNLNLR